MARAVAFISVDWWNALQDGNQAEWLGAVATTAAVLVALFSSAIGAVLTKRRQGSLEASQVVIALHRDPMKEETIWTPGEHRQDWDGYGWRWQCQVRVRNFSPSVLRNVRIAVTWDNGCPFVPHNDKPGSYQSGQTSVVPVHHLPPADGGPWVRFASEVDLKNGPIRRTPEPGDGVEWAEPSEIAKPTAVHVTWNDRFGKRWSSTPQSAPRRVRRWGMGDSR